MATDKTKANAKVVLVTGEHVNYFETLEMAQTDAERANKEAERLGITARYEAHLL